MAESVIEKTLPVAPKKLVAKRRLFNVDVDEISFVDSPAVPDSKFVIMKRDPEAALLDAPSDVSPQVAEAPNAADVTPVVAVAYVPQPQLEQVVKTQYDPQDNARAGNGAVEPETTPEEHVQALIDMMDELPEDALDHVIALADAAGIEVDDLPSVEGGDADVMDSLPTPIEDSMAGVHQAVTAANEIQQHPPEVQDALTTIHEYMQGRQSNPDQGGTAANSSPASRNDPDRPSNRRASPNPTDKDGQGNEDQRANGDPNKPTGTKGPGPTGQRPPMDRKPMPDKDERKRKILARRGMKQPIAGKRDQEAPVIVPAQSDSFWDQVGTELRKRSDSQDGSRLQSALSTVLEQQQEINEQFAETKRRFNRACGRDE
jgi:hypothetical protein